MRVVHCRIHYFRHDSVGWTPQREHAWVFESREEAWAVKCQLGNAFLLLCFGEQGGSHAA